MPLRVQKAIVTQRAISKVVSSLRRKRRHSRPPSQRGGDTARQPSRGADRMSTSQQDRRNGSVVRGSGTGIDHVSVKEMQQAGAVVWGRLSIS